jgi:hypothetical protein
MKDQNTSRDSWLKIILIGLAFVLWWWLAGKPKPSIPIISISISDKPPAGQSLKEKDSIDDDQKFYYSRQYFESVGSSILQGHTVNITRYGGLHLIHRFKVSPEEYITTGSFTVMIQDSVIRIKKPLTFAQDDQTPLLPEQGKIEIKRIIQRLKQSPDSAYIEITAYDDFTMDTSSNAFDVGLDRAGYFKKLFIQEGVHEENIELVSLNIDSLKRNSDHRIVGAIRLRYMNGVSPFQMELNKLKFSASRYSRTWNQPGDQCLDFTDQHLIIKDIKVGELGIYKELMNLSYTLVFNDRELLINDLPRFNCEFINPQASGEIQICDAIVVNPVSGNMHIKIYIKNSSPVQSQLKFSVYPVSGDEDSPASATRRVMITFAQNSQDAQARFKSAHPNLPYNDSSNTSRETIKYIRIEHASLRYDEIFLRVNNIKYFLHKEPGYVEVPFGINSKLEIWECISRDCHWILAETSFADDKYKIMDNDSYAVGHLKLIADR